MQIIKAAMSRLANVAIAIAGTQPSSNSNVNKNTLNIQNYNLFN